MNDPNRPDLRFSTPTSPRMLNYAMGGKDNFTLDRTAAQRFLEALPVVRNLPVEDRRFLHRAVRFLLDQGIRQFIDVGCGLPGNRNVHQTVHAADPGATVVYADIDPVAVVHFQSLLHAEPNAAAVQADAREPRTILEHPDVLRLIDFDRPVGVLMITVLAQIRDDAAPEGVVRAFRDAMAPGSLLALCEITDEAMTDEERTVCFDLLRQVDLVAELRPRERIAAFLDGFETLEPGLVAAPEWRPDRPYDPPTGWLLGAIARKP